MAPYCGFINGECEKKGDALKCAQESAVSCRIKREKIEQERGSPVDNKPFWCRKRKEQMVEPCSDCEDCPANKG